MNANLKITGLLSLLLICFVTFAFGQETEKRSSIGEAIYKEYQKKGIDKAILEYEKLKFNRSGDYTFNEWELNNIAYRIMQEDKDLDAAEKIFRYNMEEYPNAANPQDSYADYLIETGEPEQAIPYLERAIIMAEHSSNKEEKQELLPQSKGKLARLLNKHRQLDFLAGEWDLDQTYFNNGESQKAPKSFQKIVYLPGNSVLQASHTGADSRPCCERIMTYNAMKDSYQMAYFNASGLNGIRLSEMKIKELGTGTLEILEDYIENDVKKQARHELRKTGNDKLDWQVYLQREDGSGWELVNQMNFRKKV